VQHLFKFFPLLICAAITPAFGQTSPGSSAATRFSLHAPQAREVFLAGEMTNWEAGKRRMMRGADGVWHLTLPLAAGQWVYKYVVDGQWIADPAAASDDDGRGGQHSFLFVGEGAWTERQRIPQGRVEQHTVPSAAWGAGMNTQVYLPPSWLPGQQLPVLWLLHGYGMTPNQWSRTGRIATYLDNLLARGAIRPMVVVMPSSRDVFYVGASRAHIAGELSAWLAEVYGLKPTREKSALAGMSMGGAGALQLALDEPHRYGFSYSLSGAFRNLVDPVRKLQALPGPLVLRTGSEDHVTPSNRALHTALTAQGIKVDYREQPGGHTWHYWSGQISDMLIAVDGFFHKQ
jgi:enterochelin esterase-like enzyme